MKIKVLSILAIFCLLLACNDDDEQITANRPPQLDTPLLSLPANGSTVADSSFPLTLSWEEVSFAEFYSVRIAPQADMLNAGIALTKSKSLKIDSSLFTRGQLNYWQVQAHAKDFDQSELSEILSFIFE